MPGGPPPDNPTAATARELVEVGRDFRQLEQRRIELILRALEEGGSTRRVGFLSGTNESFVRRVIEKHASAALRKKIGDKFHRAAERNEFWPFDSQAQYDAFMKRGRDD